MTKQEAVIKYIEDNYLQFRRLRHDVISDKLQVRVAHRLSAPHNATSVIGDPAEDAALSGYSLEFKGREYWREMTKNDINSIVCPCAQECDVNITSREVMTALQSDLIPDVHPLREYILSLKPYTPDQPDWIDFVASQVKVKPSLLSDDRPKGLLDRTSCCETTCSTPKSHELFQGPRTLRDRTEGAERPMESLSECNERSLSELSERSNRQSRSISEPCERSKADRLWRGCFKKWFVAMVASWMKDEVVNHQVLVLIGKQGIYKTTWLEHLIPPHLRAYACKLANSSDLNKDERLRIAEFGLISLDEIDSMNNRELNQLKSVITATDVNERAAYAYTKERRIRLASFCASGNRRDFLTDITGNRRWLPFEVESIQNPFHTLLPYEQMYAQAWALAQDPFFSYWFDLDEIEVLEQHNQHFRDESNEEQLLDVYFAVPPTDATNAKFLTTAEISERLIYYGNIKKPMTLSRLGVLLSQKGFLSVRRGNPSRRGWIIYERESQEVNSERSILSKDLY